MSSSWQQSVNSRLRPANDTEKFWTEQGLVEKPLSSTVKRQSKTGQVSRLTERLASAEEEIVRLKRSCQFTALAEMLSAGEEYAKEVGASTCFGRCSCYR